jgi:cation transport ATPase
MEVMRESESKRPQLQRLGDQLGAIYTPVALVVALLAWFLSGDSLRFLAVLVIATPCPLLLGIPIAIISSISLCARRAIIVKSPVVLEQIAGCRTAIFDKTGTLTYGEPALTEQLVATGLRCQKKCSPSSPAWSATRSIRSHAPSLPQRRHRASPCPKPAPSASSPAMDLRGTVAVISSRSPAATNSSRRTFPAPISSRPSQADWSASSSSTATTPPPCASEMPRAESRSFVNHLAPKHHFDRVMIISGDRESEVRYLADQVGITEIHAQKSPEEKLALVRAETAKAKTLYVGDGINDAPAMMAATVGMAIGQNSDVTAEAAGVVIMDNSLKKVDEFMHISRRMRVIALQSAVGGMALSLIGMAFAAPVSSQPRQRRDCTGDH